MRYLGSRTIGEPAPKKYPRPKILLVDLVVEAEKTLAVAGSNVSTCSFGTSYKVPMEDVRSPMIPNGRLRRVYFCRPEWYIAYMTGTGHRGHASHTFYAPSVRLKRLAYSCYGVGHTAWRQPGDMRGTVVGRHGRFKTTPSIEEVMSIA